VDVVPLHFHFGCLGNTSFCPFFGISAGVDAVGAQAQGDPFDFRCPQGSYIHRYRGYVGPARYNWIYGLGPVECSDGSNSSVLWGTTTSRGMEGVSFDQGMFKADCQGFDVSFDIPKRQSPS
jgi:hypothetical protein